MNMEALESRSYGPNSKDNDAPWAFATFHNLAVPVNSPQRIRQVNDVRTLENLLGEARNHRNQALMLFLSGYPSKDWLDAIESGCLVKREFFERHLGFCARAFYEERHVFSRSTLPSVSNETLSMSMPTLGYCKRNENATQANLDQLRQSTMNEMRQHHLNMRLGTSVETGNSIIRSFAVHDNTHYAIEQDISITVVPFNNGWLGLVYLDIGKPLAIGRQGDWNSSLLHSVLRVDSWKTSFYETDTSNLFSDQRAALIHTLSSNKSQDAEAEFLQLATKARLHYGQSLKPSLVISDPLYGLSEIFALVASAQAQYLTMIEEKISRELDKALNADIIDETPTNELQVYSLSNLVYNKKILDSRLRQLKLSVDLLRNRGSPNWPQLKAPDSDGEASRKQQMVLKDFEYLVEWTANLSVSCDRGIDIAANNAVMAESKRTLTQAKRVTKLTILALIYVPASFTTSLFGMNMAQFGQGTLNIWVFPAVLIPLYITFIIFLYYDPRQVYFLFQSLARRLRLNQIEGEPKS